jgi:UDP-glucose 4-epimerase
MDSYGLSKVVNERTARAFAERTGADIYALRIGNVIEPHEYDRFPAFIADPPSRKRNAWSYIDARDLGQIRRALGEREAPISNRKIRDVLGFREAHDWRKYVTR